MHAPRSLLGIVAYIHTRRTGEVEVVEAWTRDLELGNDHEAEREGRFVPVYHSVAGAQELEAGRLRGVPVGAAGVLELAAREKAEAESRRRVAAYCAANRALMGRVEP